MFRAFTTSRKDSSGLDFATFNRKRIVETWFDDYKKFVYARNPAYAKMNFIGDLADVKKIRADLNCKNFDYFINVVAPDLTTKFPTETPAFANGSLKLEYENLCVKIGKYLDEEHREIALAPCEEADFFQLSWYRDLRSYDEDSCIDGYNVNKVGVCEC